MNEWSHEGITGLMQDARFGLLQLHKSFGFTSVAAFTNVFMTKSREK